ncbi:MAG: rubrerythrin [Deltaproteobacteria bacterium]|nr:rubrerythrin [Deltaproteobacteria bacterium]MBN2674603.1 rubrerythrin [Deltaproteobacteria bacterium]
MANTFNAEEVLEIACQIERNATLFYREAAKLVMMAESKELLLQLADMEEGHESVFEEMKERTDEFDDFLSDPDSTAASYLKAIAANHVFVSDQKPEDLFHENSTVRDILRAALSAEFASIAYFQGILDNMPAGFGRDKIKEVIMEEQEHVVIINKKIIAYASR